MRVHYFFTDSKEVMKSFLNNTEIELRVTEGNNWNKPVAISSSFALQYFQIKSPKQNDTSLSDQQPDLMVQRQGLQLHFFGPKISNFQMHMTIGIKEDMKIKTENIMLYKFNEVFFPDNSYYNSDPLPVEWIEVFQETEALKEHQALMKSNYKEVNLSKNNSPSPSPSKDRNSVMEKFKLFDSTMKTRKSESKPADSSESKHISIKKTLAIYSGISNVNKLDVKDQISDFDTNQQDNFDIEGVKVLAIEAQKPVELNKSDEEYSNISNEDAIHNILATVEEDEK